MEHVYHFRPWLEVVVEHVCDHNRAMSATCAADADCKVTLSFFLVTWKHKVDEVGQASEKLPGVGLVKDIENDPLVEACAMYEVSIVVWVGQEANVEE
jgi:wobble nucleotide-excising tRNase